MNYAMALDYQNCINCQACEVACKQENGVQLGRQKKRIWIGIVEGVQNGQPFTNIYPSQCNQCIDAPCVTVCPTSASHVVQGGIVKVDPKQCILCKGCMEACPYDARFIDDTQVAVDKCTFCDHQLAETGITACQGTCPTKVRTIGDLDDPDSDIVALLKSRKFFFQKFTEKTLPKLFYLVPEDENYAQQSIAAHTTIYSWKDIEALYKQTSNIRSKEWRK